MNSNQNGSNVLEDKDRELAIIAALVALGEKGRKHFASHVNAALDAGALRQEIVEMIGTFSQCSGSPAAMNGVSAAIKVFESRDAAGVALPGEAVFEPGDAPSTMARMHASRGRRNHPRRISGRSHGRRVHQCCADRTTCLA